MQSGGKSKCLKSIPLALIPFAEDYKPRKVVRDRPATEPRPLFLNSNVVKNSNGSSYLEAGNTKILTTVHGPLNLKPNELGGQEKSTRGSFEITVRFASFSKEIRASRREFGHSKRQDATEEEVKLGKLLVDAFSSAICLDRYPRSLIEVYVSVLEDDGGVLASAILGTSLALADGGIELYDMVLAASLLIDDKAVLVDPDRQEEKQRKEELKKEGNSCSTLVYAVMPSLNQVCLTSQTGIISAPSRLPEGLTLATEISYRLYPILQTAVSQSFTNRNSQNLISSPE